MRYEWFIAKRYLQASRRAGFVSFINAFAILGITIGTAAVIIALSILNGFERDIKEKIFGFVSHIQIVGFQGQSLERYEESIQRIRHHHPEVISVAPFVAREAMIRGKDPDYIDGVLLKGIDLEYDPGTLRGYLVEGDYLQTGDARPRQILLGRTLANKLDVRVGDRVVMFALPRQTSGSGISEPTIGQPRAMTLHVVGIFESGMAEYDNVYAFTTLANAQELFQIGEGVLGYDVLLERTDAAEAVAASIQSLLGYPHYARTASQLYRNLFAWLELQKKPAPLLLGLIIIVASVNIIGTLLMLVLEKTREIGALRSLGAGPRGIRRVFLAYGFSLGTLGALLGNILAYVLCWVQITFRPFSLPTDIYFMSSVPVLLEISDFVLVTIIVLTLSTLASLLPAKAASRLDPVIALRFG